MYKKIGLIVLLCLITYSSFAQKINFSHYTAVETQLSQSVVICSFQDSYGYLWIGTQNGLNRFDGYKFKVFLHNPNDSTTISNNWIFSIVEDKNNDIWIATKNGLNKYNRQSGNFHREYYKNDRTTKDIVYGLFKTKANNILINDENSLYKYNFDSGFSIILDKEETENKIVKDYNIPVFVDSENYIWLGSTNGILRVNPDDYSFIRYSTQNSKNYLSSDIIYSIFEDKNGFVWIGTALGINKFSLKENKFVELLVAGSDGLSDNAAYSIISDFQDNLWIGTHNGITKIIKINQNQYKFKHYYTHNSNLSHNVVYSLLVDKTENLWAGTLKNLSKTDLKPKKFNLIQKNNSYSSVDLLDNLIASIYKENDSIIWIGTWGKGLNIYDRKNKSIESFSRQLAGNKFITNNFIHSIYENQKKDIWIGTRDGLLVFNKKERSFQRPSLFYEIENTIDLEGLRIFKLIQDKKYNYWIATENGVFVFDKNLEFFKKIDSNSPENEGLSTNLVYDIIEDSKDLIWIATSIGLNLYNPKTEQITHFYHDNYNSNSLCDNFVVSLAEDSNGDIWIGTQTGANHYIRNEEKFIYYSTFNGLPGNLVYEILVDKNQNIWFATDNGLVQLDKKNNKFNIFTTFDGLQSNEFNLNAVFQDKNDGELFFGGMNGLNYFYPDSIKYNNYVPNIVFSDFTIKNSDGERKIMLDKLESIELSYLDFEFTITFAALDFTFPEKNKYKYRMIGISDKWIEIKDRNYITFSNLPHGKYTLEVQGANNDGVWSDTIKKIEIIIKPPIWKTKVAYVFYLFLIAFLVFLYIKNRERKLIKERKILEEKVVQRTQIISEQKNKIEKVHEEIKSSITYASKIQNAVLPKKDFAENIFSEVFVFFKPRNVVSGDFYYIKEINKYKIFLVADCTGHGVPGAFLSMLGISLLNDILPKATNNAAKVLEIMREQVKSVLNQHDINVQTKDGLDLGLCIYNTETKILDFSGANETLVIIRNKDFVDFEEIKANPKKIKLLQTTDADNRVLVEYVSLKNPVGIYVQEAKFFNINIKVNEDDIFYMFSDGYIDQFGGEKNQKFTRLRLKKLLFKNSELPLATQEQKLIQEFNDWQKDYYQIDDVLVMGVKI